MTDIVFASYAPNTGTVFAARRPQVFASAAASVVRVQAARSVTAAGAATLTGSVSDLLPARAVFASASASVVRALRPARSVTASGATVLTGMVTALMPSRAVRAFAVGAGAGIVLARRPTPTVSAFNAATPPPSGYASLRLPPRAVSAAGYAIYNGSVSVKVSRAVFASATDSVVRALRPARSVLSQTYAPGARTGALQPNYPIFAGAVGAPFPRIVDTALFSGTFVARSTLLLTDTAQFTDLSSFFVRLLASITDNASAADFLSTLLKAVVAEQLTLTDTPRGWLQFAQQLTDAFVASGSLGWRLDAHVAVAVALAVRDALFGPQRAQLTDAGALADAALATAEHVATLLDSFVATATLTGDALLYALLSDTAALSDAPNAYAQVLQALNDGALFGVTLYTGEDAYTAWVMTPGTRAMRRYLNYPFNSYAQMGAQLYGADAAGVYTLTGADTDAGDSIHASLRTGLLDFGTRQMKRMERAYLGYAADGTLCLRVCVTSSTGSKVDYTYKMTAVSAAAAREQRIGIGKGLKSVYWQFELDNSADGGAFELSDITVLPMVLTRRV